jgi:hypothetical protein
MKSTKEILGMALVEYKIKFSGPFTILNNLRENGKITSKEYYKASGYVQLHFPEIIERDTCITWFSIVPNDRWYNSLISKLK